MSIIVAAFEPLAGKRLLDIGCGAGVLARSLSDRRAHVSGVDPNAGALALAREAVPAGTFHQAVAEALPFADASIEGAIFLNSLHHVPRPAMHRALHEAARVVGPTRPIVVVELLTEVEAAFRRHARVAADGRVTLEQPMRAHVLTANA